MNAKFNENRDRRRAPLLTLAMISFFVLCVAFPAGAATLDAKAVRSLTSDRVWQMKLGSGYVYWSWRSDGSVCLRVGENSGKCADTGTWKLADDHLCYELTWWGASGGYKSACFRVSEREKGWYDALQDNGLSLFEFSVMK